MAFWNLVLKSSTEISPEITSMGLPSNPIKYVVG